MGQKSQNVPAIWNLRSWCTWCPLWTKFFSLEKKEEGETNRYFCLFVVGWRRNLRSIHSLLFIMAIWQYYWERETIVLEKLVLVDRPIIYIFTTIYLKYFVIFFNKLFMSVRAFIFSLFWSNFLEVPLIINWFRTFWFNTVNAQPALLNHIRLERQTSMFKPGLLVFIVYTCGFVIGKNTSACFAPHQLKTGELDAWKWRKIIRELGRQIIMSLVFSHLSNARLQLSSLLFVHDPRLEWTTLVTSPNKIVTKHIHIPSIYGDHERDLMSLLFAL